MKQEDFDELLESLDQIQESISCAHDLVYKEDTKTYYCKKCLTSIVTRGTIDSGSDIDLQ